MDGACRRPPLPPSRLPSSLPLAPSWRLQPVVADRGAGSYVWSTDGRKHLDFACGIGVLSTGHCHPRVVKAIQEQAAQIIMAQQNIFPASRPMVGMPWSTQLAQGGLAAPL